MANIPHSGLTGSDLHEPKGVASANAQDVYVADGAGSGDWTTGPGHRVLNFRVPDVSTASSHWIVTDVAGTISKIYSVIDGTIATADTDISFELAGTPVTNGTITITQSGSAAGDIDSATPTAANTVAAGDAIEIVVEGASTNTVAATLTILIAV